MTAKRMLAACLLVMMLTGMRDPFEPPADRCMVSQLSLWRYQGMVTMADAATGIVRDPAGKWRRVRVGETLPGGWRVVDFDKEEMRIATGKGCEPERWRWKREGSQHEKNSSGSAVPQ